MVGAGAKAPVDGAPSTRAPVLCTRPTCLRHENDFKTPVACCRHSTLCWCQQRSCRCFAPILLHQAAIHLQQSFGSGLVLKDLKPKQHVVGAFAPAPSVQALAAKLLRPVSSSPLGCVPSSTSGPHLRCFALAKGIQIDV